jgi:hypothetical protein
VAEACIQSLHGGLHALAAEPARQENARGCGLRFLSVSAAVVGGAAPAGVTQRSAARGRAQRGLTCSKDTLEHRAQSEGFGP